jgi:hypothetical protein
MHREINACKILVGKSEGKTSCGGPMHRWEDGNRMDLTGTGWKMWTGWF